MEEAARAPAGPPWWALTALAPAVLIVVAAMAGESGAVGRFASAVFAPFCHQDAARTYTVHGHLLPVCARCTGFYMGLALLTAVGFGARIIGTSGRMPRAMLLLLVPLLVDGSANLLGLWQTSTGLRTAVGLMAAAPLALLLVGDRHAAH